MYLWFNFIFLWKNQLSEPISLKLIPNKPIFRWGKSLDLNNMKNISLLFIKRRVLFLLNNSNYLFIYLFTFSFLQKLKCISLFAFWRMSCVHYTQVKIKVKEKFDMISGKKVKRTLMLSIFAWILRNWIWLTGLRKNA